MRWPTLSGTTWSEASAPWWTPGRKTAKDHARWRIFAAQAHLFPPRWVVGNGWVATREVAMAARVIPWPKISITADLSEALDAIDLLEEALVQALDDRLPTGRCRSRPCR